MYSNFQIIIAILLILILLHIISTNEYFKFRRCPFGRNCTRENCPFGCNKRCPNYVCTRFGCGCNLTYAKYL
jgi:hypothetical protein